jgi:hypothetical protein
VGGDVGSQWVENSGHDPFNCEHRVGGRQSRVRITPIRIPTWALGLGALVPLLLSGCLQDDAELDLRQSAMHAIAVDDAPASAPGPICPRPAPRDWAPGETVLLDVSQAETCRIIAVPGLRLSPSDDGSRPDPGGGSVVRLASGRLVTNADSRTAVGTVLVWDDDGHFLHSLGTAGDGPGEFSPNARPMLYRGPDDSLFVHERRRWSVFDPELGFVRVMRYPRSIALPSSTAVTSDGHIVFTGSLEGALGARPNWFHVFTGSGDFMRSFGQIPGEDPGPGAERPIAYAGEGTFWAAPPDGSGMGYRLEKWSVEGELRKVLTRDPPWMHGPVPLPGVSLPRFRVQVDPKGLLWTSVDARDSRGRPPRGMDEPGFSLLEHDTRELLDQWVEVIDPEASGVVLATALIDDPLTRGEVPLPVLARVPGDRSTFRVESDSLGRQALALHDWHVVAR